MHSEWIKTFYHAVFRLQLASSLHVHVVIELKNSHSTIELRLLKLVPKMHNYYTRYMYVVKVGKGQRQAVGALSLASMLQLRIVFQ